MNPALIGLFGGLIGSMLGGLAGLIELYASLAKGKSRDPRVSSLIAGMGSMIGGLAGIIAGLAGLGLTGGGTEVISLDPRTLWWIRSLAGLAIPLILVAGGTYFFITRARSDAERLIIIKGFMIVWAGALILLLLPLALSHAGIISLWMFRGSIVLFFIVDLLVVAWFARQFALVRKADRIQP